MSAPRPITLTLAALGGQGGGVVASWLTDVARRERYVVQATSVPGVAQRTGATIYYLEFFPESALPADGRRPVMALMPSPGDCDIVLASELVEAGRMIQRGLVTADRTTLIASTHRHYTIGEKSHLTDGRASSERLLAEAHAQAKRFVAFDMAEVAEREGAVISAVLLGAIAGAAGLPFARDAYRSAIRRGGIAVDRNIAGFDAGFEAARTAAGSDAQPTVAQEPPPVAPAVPAELAARIATELPAPAAEVARHAVARLIDYQDERYAAGYLDALRRFAQLDRETPAGGARLTTAVARGLALWMSFEDTIRVADLKTRADRRRRVYAQACAKPGELVQVTEFLKPRVEELCGSMPAGLGRRLLASARARRWLRRFTDGKQIRTSTIGGYLLLRGVARMRRWRRATYRFQEEHVRIGEWLDLTAGLARSDYALAVELANCQTLVRGYGDTYERGVQHFVTLSAVAKRMAGQSGAAAELARLRELATADDRGRALARALPT